MNRRLGEFVTEGRNEASRGIDRMTIEQMINLMQEEDRKVIDAIKAVRPSIIAVIEKAVEVFANSGSLIYVGAGTSGRLGVLDAAECPPTFGTDPSMVRGVIAGGREAMFRSAEGAEDDTDSGRQSMAAENVSEIDIVIGIAASVTTPFVMGALEEASSRGAYTALLTFNPVKELPITVDRIINPVTGPEVVTGSTRLKAGTATKMILNLITTVSMIRLGKVYDNLMVDLLCLSEKLRDRGRRILVELLDIDYMAAGELLERSGWHVKRGIVMGKLGMSAEQAQNALARAGGVVSAVTGEGGRRNERP